MHKVEQNYTHTHTEEKKKKKAPPSVDTTFS
jgi:hypothetical protein